MLDGMGERPRDTPEAAFSRLTCGRRRHPYEAETRNMAIEQTPSEGDRLKQAISVLEKQLRALARDLAVLHREVRSGNIAALDDAQRRTQDIRQWLGIALEMEMRLETHRQYGRGHETAGAIDLDEARSQIGCRLDRLRRARCPNRVPE